MNGHAPEFCPQTQKFEPPYETLLFTLEVEELEQESIFEKFICCIFKYYSQTRPSVPVANGLINSLMANCFRSLVP